MHRASMDAAAESVYNSLLSCVLFGYLHHSILTVADRRLYTAAIHHHQPASRSKPATKM